MSFPAVSVEDTTVLHHSDDGITTLTLNQPDQYNALTEKMLTALQKSSR